MPSIYLYVSKAKIKQLSDQKPGFLSNVTAKLNFKFPFISGGISGKTATNTVADLERLLPTLQREYDIPAFSDIPRTLIPVFFSFWGPSVLTTGDGNFWLAMEGREVALLLAGSASYALGGAASTSSRISPSAAPVQSFMEVCQGDNEDNQKELSSNLSYVWQELMGDAIREGATLPHVEGIAIFAASLKASKGQMRRANRASLKYLVVGSPLFVKQVENA